MDKYTQAAANATPEEMDKMLTRIFKAMAENRRAEKVRLANRRIRHVGRPALRATRQLTSARAYRVHLEFV